MNEIPVSGKVPINAVRVGRELSQKEQKSTVGATAGFPGYKNNMKEKSPQSFLPKETKTRTRENHRN